MPPAATSSDCFVVAYAPLPPPPIAHMKRRAEDDGLGWHVPKCRRLDSIDVVERIHSFSRQAGSSGFPKAHDDNEGNALKRNNHSTRTSDGEEFFSAVDLAPVIEQSAAQGLWPTMTSSAATQRHSTQTPYVATEHSDRPFISALGTQPTSAAPGTYTQFNSIPYTTTEYEFNFSQPPFIREPFVQEPSQVLSWGLAQQPPQRRAQANRDKTSFQAAGPSRFPGSELLWPAGAAVEDAFPSSSTPFETTGYGLQSSLAPVVRQHSQVQPVEWQSFRTQSRQHSTQARRTSAPCLRPLPIPVAEPSFGSASQTSTLSSSAPKPSNATSQKRKKKVQTPFLLAEDKCHLCGEGFRRGSELYHHWTTNKHRLREREAENPGVVVTVADLTPNCFCPSCGKGYTTPYVVKRHLKKCAGQAGSSQDTSQDGEGGR